MWNSAALKEELPNNFYRFSHESSAHSRLLQEKGEKNLNFFLPFYANFILSCELLFRSLPIQKQL